MKGNTLVLVRCPKCGAVIETYLGKFKKGRLSEPCSYCGYDKLTHKDIFYMEERTDSLRSQK